MAQSQLKADSIAAADPARWRADFPIFRQQPGLHYLDSAASAQKPDCVVEAIAACYREGYAPVHRGLYPLAEMASENYENARQTIAGFIGADSAEQLVFTRSATEAINLVAQGWAAARLQPGDEIWVSEMEHHANFLPWQRICSDSQARLRIIPLNNHGELDLENTPELYGAKTRLIAISQVSNVLGTINPVKEIAAAARERHIPVLVDAAQSVGHMPVDVADLDCDFLVASAHKLGGPTGIGFLYGKAKRLEETEPLLLGGGMVDTVGLEASSWAEVPARFEAGSPNLAGAIGFAAAVEYLGRIGIDRIEQHVAALTREACDAITAIDGVRLYGPGVDSQRGGILSFAIDGIHPHDIAQVAAEHGVAIRAGHHCCQPLMSRLGVTATARASFHLYNTRQDIAALNRAIQAAIETFGRR